MYQKGQTHFKNLQQMLEDFSSVSDHFGTLCMKGLKSFMITLEKILLTKTGAHRSLIFREQIFICFY